MSSADSRGYPAQSLLEKNIAGSQLRGLLAELIASSSDLNIRVWLDGIYTDIDDSGGHEDWMKGREVYFKVEGKVEGAKKPEDSLNGGS